MSQLMRVRMIFVVFLATYFSSAYAGSLFISHPSHPPVSDILKLRDGDTLPSYFLATFGSRQVATMIVKRLEKGENAQDPNPYYDFCGDTKIQLAFWEKLIEPIASGCFKNQHQTHSSEGLLFGEQRSAIENEMIKLKLEWRYEDNPKNPVHQLRPKYAYLGLQKSLPNLRTGYSPSYGNILAVFKDAVKKRTTFTPGDSLLVNPANETRTLSYRAAAPTTLEARYWEAQVWGEICFSDVEYFLVNCSILRPASEAAIEKLKTQKIPIYQCEVDQIDRFTRLRPGALIYSPDTVKN